MIIKILYLITKYLCHRGLLAEENVEFYVSHINFANSNYLDVGQEKHRRFLLMNYIPFRTCFRMWSVGETLFHLLPGMFGQELWCYEDLSAFDMKW